MYETNCFTAQQHSNGGGSSNQDVFSVYETLKLRGNEPTSSMTAGHNVNSASSDLNPISDTYGAPASSNSQKNQAPKYSSQSFPPPSHPQPNVDQYQTYQVPNHQQQSSSFISTNQLDNDNSYQQQDSSSQYGAPEPQEIQYVQSQEQYGAPQQKEQTYRQPKQQDQFFNAPSSQYEQQAVDTPHAQYEQPQQQNFPADAQSVQYNGQFQHAIMNPTTQYGEPQPLPTVETPHSQYGRPQSQQSVESPNSQYGQPQPQQSVESPSSQYGQPQPQQSVESQNFQYEQGQYQESVDSPNSQYGQPQQQLISEYNQAQRTQQIQHSVEPGYQIQVNYEQPSSTSNHEANAYVGDSSTNNNNYLQLHTANPPSSSGGSSCCSSCCAASFKVDSQSSPSSQGFEIDPRHKGATSTSSNSVSNDLFKPSATDPVGDSVEPQKHFSLESVYNIPNGPLSSLESYSPNEQSQFGNLESSNTQDSGKYLERATRRVSCCMVDCETKNCSSTNLSVVRSTRAIKSLLPIPPFPSGFMLPPKVALKTREFRPKPLWTKRYSSFYPNLTKPPYRKSLVFFPDPPFFPSRVNIRGLREAFKARQNFRYKNVGSVRFSSESRGIQKSASKIWFPKTLKILKPSVVPLLVAINPNLKKKPEPPVYDNSPSLLDHFEYEREPSPYSNFDNFSDDSRYQPEPAVYDNFVSFSDDLTQKPKSVVPMQGNFAIFPNRPNYQEEDSWEDKEYPTDPSISTLSSYAVLFRNETETNNLSNPVPSSTIANDVYVTHSSPPVVYSTTVAPAKIQVSQSSFVAPSSTEKTSATVSTTQVPKRKKYRKRKYDFNMNRVKDQKHAVRISVSTVEEKSYQESSRGTTFLPSSTREVEKMSSEVPKTTTEVTKIPIDNEISVSSTKMTTTCQPNLETQIESSTNMDTAKAIETNTTRDEMGLKKVWKPAKVLLSTNHSGVRLQFGNKLMEDSIPPTKQERLIFVELKKAYLPWLTRNILTDAKDKNISLSNLGKKPKLTKTKDSFILQLAPDSAKNDSMGPSLVDPKSKIISNDVLRDRNKKLALLKLKNKVPFLINKRPDADKSKKSSHFNSPHVQSWRSEMQAKLLKSSNIP